MSDITSARGPAEGSFDGIETGIGDLIGITAKIVLGAAAVFGLWAVVVPLQSAVVANGTVISGGQNKALQHRTGGIVTAIHVREGKQVKAGDVIFELDPVVDQAELTRLRGRRAVLLALKSRLEAEKQFTGQPRQAGAPAPAAAAPGAAQLTPAENQILAEQTREFEKGRSAIMAELEALRQKGEALRKQQAGVLNRVRFLKQQVEILSTQHVSAVSLERRGHISKQQAWDIESRLLDRRAELALATSESEAMSNSLEENRSLLEQIKFRDERLTSEKLTEVFGELEQTSDQLRAAETALSNTQIRAPVSGTLVRSTVATVGGIIKPADTIGEIVPEGATLEVEARVSPKDIGAVHIGQDAEVKISALNARIFSQMPAEVVYVAADSSTEERTGERYFPVRVVLKKGSPPTGAHIGIGMTGEVFLKAEPRTFLSYLMRPFIDSLGRAFGERS